MWLRFFWCKVYVGIRLRHVSGQIIVTSRYLTPNGGLVREITLLHGNLGWWNIMIWPDVYLCWAFLFLANLWHRRPCYIFFGAVFCAEFFTDGKLPGHWKCLSTSLATSPSKSAETWFFLGGRWSCIWYKQSCFLGKLGVGEIYFDAFGDTFVYIYVYALG